MSKQPTIAIITATHGRPLVTELFIYGIDRLRKALGEEFPVVVTGDSHPLFEEYGIEYHYKENEPVSDKFNVSLHYAMRHKPKHIMVLGSDNLMLNEYFLDFINFKKDLDYTGFKCVYFYSLDGETMGQVKQQNSSIIIGAGRTMSYSLLERSLPHCRYRLWDKPKNRSLDNMMHNNLYRYIGKQESHPAFVIDVKTKDNLNRFDLWKGLKEDIPEWDLLLDMSSKERDVIKKIKKRI